MELYFKGPAPDFTTQRLSQTNPNPASWEAMGLKRENTQLLPSPYSKGEVPGRHSTAEPEGSQSGAKNRFSMKIKEMIDKNLVQELRTGIRLRADKAENKQLISALNFHSQSVTNIFHH